MNINPNARTETSWNKNACRAWTMRNLERDLLTAQTTPEEIKAKKPQGDAMCKIATTSCSSLLCLHALSALSVVEFIWENLLIQCLKVCNKTLAVGYSGKERVESWSCPSTRTVENCLRLPHAAKRIWDAFHPYSIDTLCWGDWSTNAINHFAGRLERKNSCCLLSKSSNSLNGMPHMSNISTNSLPHR